MEHQESVETQTAPGTAAAGGGAGGEGEGGGGGSGYLTPYNYPHTFPVSPQNGAGSGGNLFGRKLSSASNFSSGTGMEEGGNGNGDCADHLYDAKPPKVKR